MEQVFDSEESTSSESGWTLYLQHDHSNIHHDHFSWNKLNSVADHQQQQQQEDDDEEDDDDADDDDMSMVSDASSGPPHFQEHQEQDDHEYSNNDNNNNSNDDGHVFCHPPLRKRRKMLNQTSFHSHIHLQDHLPDHDTASSSFFTTKDLKVCNKEDDIGFDYSQGHSTTYSEMV